MRKVHVKSVVPIYAAALAWVLWALLLPLYKWWHFLLAAAVSVLFNRLASLIWKGETVLMPEPEPEPEKTGNPELDKFLADGSAAIAELTRLSSSIKKPDIKQGILRLIGISEKIFSHVKENPQKLSKVRRFANYYLPTTIKLFEMYDRMGAQGIDGENIGGTMVRIENISQTIVSAFEKQLDALFADEALDISTDITVLENLLKAGGFSMDKQQSNDMGG
jgi:hypothetical protein